jgi:hypothetical protein
LLHALHVHQALLLCELGRLACLLVLLLLLRTCCSTVLLTLGSVFRDLGIPFASLGFGLLLSTHFGLLLGALSPGLCPRLALHSLGFGSCLAAGIDLCLVFALLAGGLLLLFDCPSLLPVLLFGSLLEPTLDCHLLRFFGFNGGQSSHFGSALCSSALALFLFPLGAAGGLILRLDRLAPQVFGNGLELLRLAALFSLLLFLRQLLWFLLLYLRSLLLAAWPTLVPSGRRGGHTVQLPLQSL